MSEILYAEQLEFLDIIKYPVIKIEENKFTFITGESGCGKSTLLKILNRTVIPQKGFILYNNNDVKNMDIIEYRKAIMLVPQNNFLYDGTIKENFNIYYEAREEKLIEDIQMTLALQMCCIDFSLDTKCDILSGGEKQRVFLAIFLSLNPQIILLDEPTSALDEKTAMELLSNIKKYCIDKNITPVAVCHSRNLVTEFADEVITLEKGGVSNV